MDPMPLSRLARAAGAVLLAPAAAGRIVRGVSTDSRTVAPGEVFFALEGERFDGHDHVPEALEAGAVAAVVRPAFARTWLRREDPPGPVLVASEPLSALGRLARTVRELHDIRVVAVTGSVGKTTTKEILGRVLGDGPEVVRAERSFNNRVGVPRTLLRSDRSTRFVVCELGTSAPGEIARLARICRPDIGVITRVAPGHLEGLGSLEGVIREKGALARALGASGPLFVNGDCAGCRRIARSHPGPVARVGIEGDDLLLAGRVARSTVEGLVLSVEGRTIRTDLVGRHQATNLLLALAVGTWAGVPPEAMAERVARVPLPGGRLQMREIGGVRVVDDAYNASPVSVRAAIEVLGELPATRRLLVLGPMLELGEAAVDLHREAGEAVEAGSVDRLVCVGDLGAEVAAGAREAGLPADRVHELAEPDGVPDLLAHVLAPGDACLLKASNAVGLSAAAERLAERLETRASVAA